MDTQTPDFVTVDMRGMKAALVARAGADRASVSVLVRAAVATQLGWAEPTAAHAAEAKGAWTEPTLATVKLSIRMTAAEAEQLVAGSRAAGLSRGAYLAGLIAGVPVLTKGACRSDHVAALVASSAELSTLIRNIHHLTALLRHGEVRAAQEYRQTLDTLADNVRRHLVLASRVLAELRPRGQGAGRSKPPTA